MMNTQQTHVVSSKYQSILCIPFSNALFVDIVLFFKYLPDLISVHIMQLSNGTENSVSLS